MVLKLLEYSWVTTAATVIVAPVPAASPPYELEVLMAPPVAAVMADAAPLADLTRVDWR